MNNDLRKHKEFICQGCGREMDRFDMVDISDDQGIFVGRFCSRECAEKNSKIKLHRTWEEARNAGDWGDDD